MKQKQLNHTRGFTLVELLVVVAIIAILSVIGLTIFTSAQANARDARRKSDIDAIANAIEVTRNPGALNYSSLSTSSFSSGTVPCDNNCVTDNTKNNYCIAPAVSGAALPTPPTSTTTWLGTQGCPSGWVNIPSGGIPSGTGTMSTTSFGVNITGWYVCAKLESGGSVYCKASAQ